MTSYKVGQAAGIFFAVNYNQLYKISYRDKLLIACYPV